MPTIACTAEPTTTTVTKTTSSEYETITQYFWDVALPTADAAELTSIASAIESRESEWDATRWATPTSRGDSGDGRDAGDDGSGGGDGGGGGGGGEKPSTTTTAHHEPSPTARFAIFAHSIVDAGRYGGRTAWVWEGFQLPWPDYTAKQVCDGQNTVIAGDFFSAGQSYPKSLGQFDLDKYSNCRYNGEKDTVGKVTCDGGVTIHCKGIDSTHINAKASVACYTPKNAYWMQVSCPYH